MPRPALLLLVFLILGTSACRTSASASLKKGNELFAQGKYADAALRYRKAIQTNPNFGEAYYRLGLASLKLGKGSDAYANLMRAYQLLPQDLEVKRELAEFCLGAYLADPPHRAIMYQQAKTLDDQMLQANANSSEGLRLQGYLALIDKKPDTAIELLKRSAELDPKDASAPLSLADALMKNGHQAEGEQVARDLIRRKPDYGPAYDVLYRRYVAMDRQSDAENLLKERIQANPKDSTAILELAGFYQQRQKTAAAEATLKTLSDRPKDFPQADSLMGDFHRAVKNYQAARQDYQRGLASDSANRNSYLRRIAGVYMLEGNAAEGRKTLEDALQSDPADAVAKTALAGLLTQGQDAKERERGVTLYQELLQAQPNDANLHFALGQAYLVQGKPDQARQELQEAAKKAPAMLAPLLALAQLSLTRQDYSAVVRYSEQGLILKPGDAQLRYLRASGLMGTGAYSQARFDLNQLLRDYPDSMDAKVQLGLLDVAEHKYREAEGLFQKLYQPGHLDLRPLRGLVQTYLAEKQGARAVQVVQEALSRAPESPDLALLLASTASQSGRVELAQQQLLQLMTRYPYMAELYVRMAELETGRRDFAAAYQNLKKARELEPQRPGIDALVAVTEQSLGLIAEAQADYRKALAKDPQDIGLLNNFAFLMADAGSNLDEALQLAHNGLQKHPDEPHLLDTMAWIYIRKNQAQAAAGILQKLTRQYPDSAVFHLHYGLAFLSQGDKVQARRELQTALRKNPTDNQQKQIQQALQQAG